MNIILVHGFLNRGRIMRQLSRRLAEEGHRCFTPTLRPSDARHGIPDLAAKLRDYIRAELPPAEQFILIGFSMGAIVCRYFLHELGGNGRTAAFFSIAGPHAGTVTAHFYPSRGVREMRPGSRLLAGLEASRSRGPTVPTVCYWTPYDLMVWPGRSARLSGAEHVRVPVLVHSLLVFNRALFRDIAERIQILEREGKSHSKVP